MVYKYIIDGAPGSGKTTLLIGTDQDGYSYLNFTSLRARGFNVITPPIAGLIRELAHSK